MIHVFKRLSFYTLSVLFLCSAMALHAQERLSHVSDPLQVIKIIGDKLIRETPFEYKLTVASNSDRFNAVQVIDFGRTFGLHDPAVAYAYTLLSAEEDTDINIETTHNDGCKIWINGAMVYENKGKRSLQMKMEERGIEMDKHFTARLRKGKNTLLIKSETRGDEWAVYLQPPGRKGAVENNKVQYPSIGLKEMYNVDDKVAALSNWLVIGPFNNADGSGMEKKYGPEDGVALGTMYEGNKGKITWTIPKIEVLGNVFDPKPWGTNYNWNYHNGGVAWAMQQLAEVSGEKKYDQYATAFCDFHINGADFVEYQVKKLRAVNSANSQFLFSPLLDFTLAPALPFIYKLRKQNDFENRDAYEKYIERMLRYAKDEQVRLPGSNIYTRLSPEKYTTWVDDMFMGIPFLMQASQYANSPKEKKFFLDDAASQTLKFSEQVWDLNANLYGHAKYSEKDVKLAHWSRANGWGIWAVTEVLMQLPKNHPNYKAILAHYRNHVNALVALQAKNGFWHNVLDRPDSKEEVSGTAIFVMAIARGVSNGWLDRKKYSPVAAKGWEAIKTQIEPDGTVHNICMGTMCSEDVTYYLNRPFYDDDTHGLFAVLFAGIEMHKLQR